MNYFPPLEKVSHEIIATAIALIVVSVIVAKTPYLKNLVKNYQL